MPPTVSLRDVQPADIPSIFFEGDPAYCAMAMIKPRSFDAFKAVWDQIFRDAGTRPPGVTQKVILATTEGRTEICGSIGIRLVDRTLAVGYGIGRPHWGRGIASRALALLLTQVPQRPLHARAAASNDASIRVLTKNGFVIQSREAGPETERYLACEEVNFMLA